MQTSEARAPEANPTLARLSNVVDEPWQDYQRLRAQRNITTQQAHASNGFNQPASQPHPDSLQVQSSHGNNQPSHNWSLVHMNSRPTQQNTVSQPGQLYQQNSLHNWTGTWNGPQYLPSALIRQTSMGEGPNQHVTAGTVSESELARHPEQSSGASVNVPIHGLSREPPQSSRVQGVSGSTSMPSNAGSVHDNSSLTSSSIEPCQTGSQPKPLTRLAPAESLPFTVHDDTTIFNPSLQSSVQSVQQARRSNIGQQTPPRMTRTQSSGLSARMTLESPAATQRSNHGTPSPHRGRSQRSPAKGQHQTPKIKSDVGGNYLPR
ncbi:hypothetical protein ES702_01129 [subsurface metagenome]